MSEWQRLYLADWACHVSNKVTIRLKNEYVALLTRNQEYTYHTGNKKSIRTISIQFGKYTAIVRTKPIKYITKMEKTYYTSISFPFMLSYISFLLNLNENGSGPPRCGRACFSAEVILHK